MDNNPDLIINKTIGIVRSRTKATEFIKTLVMHWYERYSGLHLH